MPLQIRRGTTSQRLSITPLVSELVYDTTTKLVYVGDGVTAGGIAIDQDSSPDFPLGDLSDITLEELAEGDILRYDGENWINSELSFSSLVGVNLNSPEINQVLKFNGTSWTNENEDSSLTVSALEDLTNVEITDLATDQILKYNGTNWVNGDIVLPGSITADVTGSIFADNSTMLVDAVNGSISWSVISDAPSFLVEIPGSITADITGSIFADDSSIIVDSVNNVINIDNIVTSDTLEITNANLNSSTKLKVLSDNGQSILQLSRTSNNDISSPAGIPYGLISFERDDINGVFSTGLVAGYSSGVIFGSTNALGNIVDAGLISSSNGENIGIGTTSPSVNANVDIRGILKLEPQSGPPAVLEEGMVAVANRTDWDPASKGTGGSYPVYYDGTGWQAFF